MKNIKTEWDDDAEEWVPVLPENEDDAMKEAIEISNKVQESANPSSPKDQIIQALKKIVA